MLCRPILQLPVPEVQDIYKCASTYCEGEKVVPQQPNSANRKVEALFKYIYIYTVIIDDYWTVNHNQTKRNNKDCKAKETNGFETA